MILLSVNGPPITASSLSRIDCVTLPITRQFRRNSGGRLLRPCGTDRRARWVLPSTVRWV